MVEIIEYGLFVRVAGDFGLEKVYDSNQVECSAKSFALQQPSCRNAGKHKQKSENHFV